MADSKAEKQRFPLTTERIRAIASNTFELSHFIHDQVVMLTKFFIVGGGILASLVAMVMIARRISTQDVLPRILPHTLLLFVFGLAYLYVFLA